MASTGTDAPLRSARTDTQASLARARTVAASVAAHVEVFVAVSVAAASAVASGAGSAELQVGGTSPAKTCMRTTLGQTLREVCAWAHTATPARIQQVVPPLLMVPLLVPLPSSPSHRSRSWSAT